MILENKKGIIFGALDEHSLAWKVAKRCMEEGASIVLSNTEIAAQLGNITQIATESNIPFITCDATSISDLQSVFIESQRILGGKIDFVLHSIAQSQNLRRHKRYDEINYDYFVRTIDISAMSFHKMVQTAMDLDAMASNGSIVTFTYIASERYFEGYNDMADAKALLESFVRQLGAIYGKKKGVRINAISQSAVPTRAGGQWEDMDFFYRYANELSPLGSATSEECADLCVALFSDLTRKVTMQTIYNDGGFSKTMLTRDLMQDFKIHTIGTI